MGDLHSNEQGCKDHIVRKKLRLPSKTLRISAAADASKGESDHVNTMI